MTDLDKEGLDFGQTDRPPPTNPKEGALMQPGAAFVIHLQPSGSRGAVTGSAAVSEEALAPSSLHFTTSCTMLS